MTDSPAASASRRPEAFRPRLAEGLALYVLFDFYYTAAIKEIREPADLWKGENLIFAPEYYGKRQGSRVAFIRLGADF